MCNPMPVRKGVRRISGSRGGFGSSGAGNGGNNRGNGDGNGLEASEGGADGGKVCVYVRVCASVC